MKSGRVFYNDTHCSPQLANKKPSNSRLHDADYNHGNWTHYSSYRGETLTSTPSPPLSEAGDSKRSQSPDEFSQRYRKCEDILVAINAATAWQQTINDEIFRQVKFDNAVSRRIAAKAKRVQRTVDNMQGAAAWLTSRLTDLAVELQQRAETHAHRVLELEGHHASIQKAIDSHYELMEYTSKMGDVYGDEGTISTNVSTNQCASSSHTSDRSPRDEDSPAHRDVNSSHVSARAGADSATMSFRTACHKFEMIRKLKLNLTNKLDYLKAHHKTTESQLHSKEASLATLAQLADKTVSHGQLEYRMQETESRIRFLQKRKQQAAREIHKHIEALSQFHCDWMPSLVVLVRVITQHKTSIDATLEKSLTLLSSACLSRELQLQPHSQRKKSNNQRILVSEDKTEANNTFLKNVCEQRIKNNSANIEDKNRIEPKDISRKFQCERKFLILKGKLKRDDRTPTEHRSKSQINSTADCSHNKCQSSNYNSLPYHKDREHKELCLSPGEPQPPPRKYVPGCDQRQQNKLSPDGFSREDDVTNARPGINSRCHSGSVHRKKTTRKNEFRNKQTSETSIIDTDKSPCDAMVTPERRLANDLLRGIKSGQINLNSAEHSKERGETRQQSACLRRGTSTENMETSSKRNIYTRSPEKTKVDLMEMDQMIEEKRSSLESFTKFLDARSSPAGAPVPKPRKSLSAEVPNKKDAFQRESSKPERPRFHSADRRVEPAATGTPQRDQLENASLATVSSSAAAAGDAVNNNKKPSVPSVTFSSDVEIDDVNMDSLKTQNFINKYAGSVAKSPTKESLDLKNSSLSSHTNNSYNFGSKISSIFKKTSNFYSGGLGHYKPYVANSSDYFSKINSKRFNIGLNRRERSTSEISTNSLNTSATRESSSLFSRNDFGVSNQSVGKYTPSLNKLSHLGKNFNNSEFDISGGASSQENSDVLEFTSPRASSAPLNNSCELTEICAALTESKHSNTHASSTCEESVQVPAAPKEPIQAAGCPQPASRRGVLVCAVRPLAEQIQQAAAPVVSRYLACTQGAGRAAEACSHLYPRQPHLHTQPLSDRYTQGLADRNTQGLSDTNAQGLSVRNTQGLSETDSKGLSESNTQGLSERNTQGLSKRNTQGLSERNTQGSSERNTQGSSERNTQGLSERNTQGLSERNTQGLSERNTPLSTERNTQGMSGKHSNVLADRNNQYLTGKSTEMLTDRITNNLTDINTQYNRLTSININCTRVEHNSATDTDTYSNSYAVLHQKHKHYLSTDQHSSVDKVEQTTADQRDVIMSQLPRHHRDHSAKRQSGFNIGTYIYTSVDVTPSVTANYGTDTIRDVDVSDHDKTASRTHSQRPGTLVSLSDHDKTESLTHSQRPCTLILQPDHDKTESRTHSQRPGTLVSLSDPNKTQSRTQSHRQGTLVSQPLVVDVEKRLARPWGIPHTMHLAKKVVRFDEVVRCKVTD